MGCCCGCCKDEFKRENFNLDYKDPNCFGQSQWGSPSIFYLLLWRWPTFIFFMVVLVFSILNNIENAKDPWPVYVTSWAIAMLIISCLLEAICASYHLARYNRGKKCTTMPVLFKVSWIFYNFMNPSAFVVSLVYWGLLYKGDDTKFHNIGVHAINSIYVFINMFVSGHPTRILHIFQAMIPPALWFIMSGIYYAVTDSVIYGVLDFGTSPLTASLIGLGLTFIAMPLFHMIVFGLYKLRVLIYDKCGSRKQVAENDYEEKRNNSRTINADSNNQNTDAERESHESEKTEL